MTRMRFKFDQASFPGSFAVVQGDAKRCIPAASRRTFYLRRVRRHGAGLRRGNRQGDDVFHRHLTDCRRKRDLTVVETEDGAPNGYSAPGLLFFSPHGDRQDR